MSIYVGAPAAPAPNALAYHNTCSSDRWLRHIVKVIHCEERSKWSARISRDNTCVAHICICIYIQCIYIYTLHICIYIQCIYIYTLHIYVYIYDLEAGGWHSLMRIKKTRCSPGGRLKGLVNRPVWSSGVVHPDRSTPWQNSRGIVTKTSKNVENLEKGFSKISKFSVSFWKLAQDTRMPKVKQLNSTVLHSGTHRTISSSFGSLSFIIPTPSLLPY